MKNTLISLGFIFLNGLVAAEALPDNIYFRAMQEEMQRTKKELRLPDGPKPFYITYDISRTEQELFFADLGQEGSKKKPNTTEMGIHMYVGDNKQNSSGFRIYPWEDEWVYNRYASVDTGDSYELVRTQLWRQTDWLYLQEAKTAAKKEAYRRQKNLLNELPDFSAAPKASFVDTITPYPAVDGAKWKALLKELSAAGTQIPNCNEYHLILGFGKNDWFFLDSEGNFWQRQLPLPEQLRMRADFIDADGYRRYISKDQALPLDIQQVEPFVREKAAQFLAQVKALQHAKKTEPYIGPALLTAQAAGGFFDRLFVAEMANTKPLLDEKDRPDETLSSLVDRVGTRVLSPMFDVFDRPQEREYEGFYLRGFFPMDREGVRGEELHLVEQGKLKMLPTTRSLIKGQTRSNGHAIFDSLRAGLTNTFFEPSVSYSWEELEQQLLARCKELGLSYGYIFHSFPSEFAERIYLDGRREMVYGIELKNLSTRQLRDIRAAGDKLERWEELNGLQGLVAPAILVDELEIIPNQKKPDRKPLVPMP